MNYGLSGAYRINEGFAIGGGVSLYTLNLDSTFRRFGTVGDIFGPPDTSTELFRIVQDGDDTAFGFSGGVQITPHPKVRIGAVYRAGPNFTVGIAEILSGETVPDFQASGEMRVPDVFSTGVMVRPTEALMLAFDYAFVRYSELEEDYVTMQTGIRKENFKVDDGNEIHGGVEYVFTNAPALPALRFGLWYDPDHAVRYEPTAANDPFDIRFAATLPGDEDLVHYTTGLGLSFNPQFELNIAADLTSKRQTISSSVIYRFR